MDVFSFMMAEEGYNEGYDDGFEAGYDEGAEQPFEDEDDAFINSNDPLRKNQDLSECKTSPGQTIAIVGAMLDDERAQRTASSDKNEKADWEEDSDDEVAIRYVSMNDHLNSEDEKPTMIGGSPVLPKRPFEQWVDDVLSGKKTYDDPL